MLACGIPAYRLPREVVDKVVAALERMGVEIELNAEIGSLKPLRRDFDAVFVGTGLWRDKKLGIAGEERLGSGLEFLMAARAGKASCSGKRVLVIGGGSVAVDVAVSAARLGARSVAMACLESRSEMPAFPEDIEQALQEKVELLPSWGPLRVLDRGLELVRCVSVFDAEKRFRPVFDPSVTRVFAADEVILAIGLCADKKLETHLKGVFAGGDGASGPGSVASAIAAGRKAAQEMDLYLTGKKRRSKSEAGPMLEFNPAALERSERARVPAPRRKIDAEDRGTLSEAAVLDEAQRCGNCGCVAVNASDLAPALVALGAKIKTSNRTLKACEFFASRPLKTTVLEQGELVCEVFVPKPKAGARQGFSKFRLRNAIDFAIVSAAWVLDVRDGKIRDASIVLGAVGPVPVRLREVEEFLRGRAVDEATAARAGELAVRECHPLARNGFKVQVVKALVRRAVLGES
jgi:thioredoxin reductase